MHTQRMHTTITALPASEHLFIAMTAVSAESKKK
jgi:hypothetical protein